MSWKDKKKASVYNKKYKKKHYAENKEYYKQKTKERKRRLRLFIWEKKINQKCIVCDEDDPHALTFHHVDPKTKRYDVSKMSTLGLCEEKIDMEVEKCVIMCMNCQLKYHHDYILK